MKHAVLLITLLQLMIYWGCRESQSSLTESSSDTTSTLSDSLRWSDGLVYRLSDAIIVGEGVRLRGKPDVAAPVIEKLHTGKLLRIIGRSDRKQTLGRLSLCDPAGYYWKEVVTSDGQTGWVYGEFVYELLHPGKMAEIMQYMSEGLAPRFINRQYTYHNNGYRTGLARAKRTVVQKGLHGSYDTLCITFLFPYFYHDHEGEVYPWQFVANPRNPLAMIGLATDKGYLQWATNGLYRDQPDAFQMLDSELQLTVARDDFSGDVPYRYTLGIRKENNRFVVTPSDPGKEYLP